MTHSLRTRLIMGVVGGMLLLLVVSDIIIYGLVRRALINQFNASLLSTAEMLAASVEQEADKISLEVELQQMPEFQRTERPTYYELWRHDGTVIASSPSLGTDDFLSAKGVTNMPVFRTLNLKNGRPVRAVGFKFSPGVADNEKSKFEKPAETAPLTLVVARDASDLHHNLQFLRWLLSIASAGTIALSFLVGGFVVRHGLVPLNSLASEIAAIKGNNLTYRIADKSLPIEILPIKNRLNDLLARLEVSFNRERQFTANVAHELRTPLAGMSSTIEVALTQIRKPGEYQEALSDCLTIARSMQTMVNNLLTLTRIDAGQVNFHRDRIHLTELIDSCWRLLLHRAVARSVTFENRIPPEMTCSSDPDGLSMVVSNLLENAVEYTNEKGQIWIEGSQTNDKVEVIIANTGCRLTNDEVSQAFDCFWRGDASRADTGTHCGLGLALVQRITAALGGSAVVEVRPGGIFIMRLVLPA